MNLWACCLTIGMVFPASFKDKPSWATQERQVPEVPGEIHREVGRPIQTGWGGKWLQQHGASMAFIVVWNRAWFQRHWLKEVQIITTAKGICNKPKLFRLESSTTIIMQTWLWFTPNKVLTGFCLLQHCLITWHGSMTGGVLHQSYNYFCSPEWHHNSKDQVAKKYGWEDVFNGRQPNSSFLNPQVTWLQVKGWTTTIWLQPRTSSVHPTHIHYVCVRVVKGHPIK